MWFFKDGAIWNIIRQRILGLRENDRANHNATLSFVVSRDIDHWCHVAVAWLWRRFIDLLIWFLISFNKISCLQVGISRVELIVLDRNNISKLNISFNF